MRTRKTRVFTPKKRETPGTGAREPATAKGSPARSGRPSRKTLSQEIRVRAPARRLQVYRAWCKKCSICVAFCPTGALAQDSEGYPCWAEAASCTNCGLCELRCPDFAIEVFDWRRDDREAAV